MKPDFIYDPNEEAALLKELVLQVRKTIGPFAAPKRVVLVSDLPKTRSGKVSYISYSHISQVNVLTTSSSDILDHETNSSKD